MSDDPKLSQRYRELPREEPPRALDESILAASRRAVEARPAPLVAPTGRRRWYVPLAAAAVITLAVAVTLHVQHDKPSEEIDAVLPAMKVQEVPKAGAPAAAEERKVGASKDRPKMEAPKQAAEPASPQFAPDPRADLSGSAAAAPATSAETAAAPASNSGPAPAAEPAPVTHTAPAAAARKLERDRADRLAAERSAADRSMKAPVQTKTAAELVSARPVLAQMARSPEQWLQGIADLRRQGRHEEADRELLEFRKRYPDYRLSGDIKAKVEKPQ